MASCKRFMIPSSGSSSDGVIYYYWTGTDAGGFTYNSLIEVYGPKLWVTLK